MPSAHQTHDLTHLYQVDEFNRWIQIIRVLLQLVPSLYSILPFWQVLTLLNGMSFDWPNWLDPVFLVCTTVALNINLTMAHCFGFFPSLFREWIAFMLVPWLHLVFNVAKWYIVRWLHQQSHSGGSFSSLVDRTWLIWIKDEQQIERYTDARISATIWSFYATVIPCLSKSLDLFSCEPILADSNAGSFLRSRPTIQCWEGEHIF